MTAMMPEHEVELAQPLEIPLTVTDEHIASITITQHDALHTYENQRTDLARAKRIP